jgi:signal transduction histidine kinase
MPIGSDYGIELDGETAQLFSLPERCRAPDFLERTFLEDRPRIQRAFDSVSRTLCPVVARCRMVVAGHVQNCVTLRLCILLGNINVRVTEVRNFVIEKEESESPYARVNESLRRSETRLTLAYFASRDVVWDWYVVPNHLYVSASLAELLGFEKPHRALKEGEFCSLLHPDDVANERAARKSHIEDHKRYDVEYRLRTGTGTYRWFRAIGEALLDEDGIAQYMAGTISDIDAQKLGDLELVEQRNEQVALTHQLQDVSLRLIKAQENERRHIARELHDQTGQTLTAALLDLEFWRGRSVPAEEIDRLSLEIKRALGEIRDISLSLRPPLLDEEGLESALRSYLSRQALAANFTVNFAVDGMLDRQPAEIDITAFRLVQEAVTNIVRHAHAKHVEVSLNVTPTELTLRISDDGTGYVADEALANAVSGVSLGMISMHERAALLGGKCEFTSTKSVGSIVQVHIPLG